MRSDKKRGGARRCGSDDVMSEMMEDNGEGRGYAMRSNIGCGGDRG